MGVVIRYEAMSSRALYCIAIYKLYQFFRYTIYIVSFILDKQYFKQYIFA